MNRDIQMQRSAYKPAKRKNTYEERNASGSIIWREITEEVGNKKTRVFSAEIRNNPTQTLVQLVRTESDSFSFFTVPEASVSNGTYTKRMTAEQLAEHGLLDFIRGRPIVLPAETLERELGAALEPQKGNKTTILPRSEASKYDSNSP